MLKNEENEWEVEVVNPRYDLFKGKSSFATLMLKFEFNLDSDDLSVFQSIMEEKGQQLVQAWIPKEKVVSN